jgi:hypothetical protein
MPVAETFLQFRIDATTKRLFQTVADRQETLVSALLKRLVTEYLDAERATSITPSSKLSAALGLEKSDRITVRVLPADRQVLKERAKARSLRETTYLRMLIHSHVRLAGPVPAIELQALRDSAAELRAITKRLDRLTRLMGAGAAVDKAWPAEALAVMQACERLRDHVRAFIRANIRSWETGNAEARR